MVIAHLAGEAFLTFCSSAPARGEARKAPRIVETIQVAVLRAGEAPWGMQGLLRRDTAPASIDWQPKATIPEACILDAIQGALDYVRKGAPINEARATISAAGRAR
jgi:hypothetical protein